MVTLIIRYVTATLITRRRYSSVYRFSSEKLRIERSNSRRVSNAFHARISSKTSEDNVRIAYDVCDFIVARILRARARAVSGKQVKFPRQRKSSNDSAFTRSRAMNAKCAQRSRVSKTKRRK